MNSRFSPIMGAGTEQAESEEDWLVECSDEENYGPAGHAKGVWEPDPKDILDLYTKLDKGEKLTLEWECPGRRSPSPERQEEELQPEEPVEEEPKEEVKVVPTEFDFDDMMDTGPTITPRRTPGSSKTPRSGQRRVATMDNIIKDLFRHNKKRNKSPGGGTPDGTPQRPLNKFKMRKDVPL